MVIIYNTLCFLYLFFFTDPRPNEKKKIIKQDVLVSIIKHNSNVHRISHEMYLTLQPDKVIASIIIDFHLELTLPAD